jgi:hypothetical protein
MPILAPKRKVGEVFSAHSHSQTQSVTAENQKCSPHTTQKAESELIELSATFTLSRTRQIGFAPKTFEMSSSKELRAKDLPTITSNVTYFTVMTHRCQKEGALDVSQV